MPQHRHCHAQGHPGPETSPLPLRSLACLRPRGRLRGTPSAGLGRTLRSLAWPCVVFAGFRQPFRRALPGRSRAPGPSRRANPLRWPVTVTGRTALAADPGTIPPIPGSAAGAVGTRSTRPNLLTITTTGRRPARRRSPGSGGRASSRTRPRSQKPLPGTGHSGGLPGPGSLGGLVKRYPCIDWPIRVGRTFTRCSRGDQNELVRVVVTRIEWDGATQRRMVDTAQRSGGVCRVRTRSWV